MLAPVLLLARHFLRASLNGKMARVEQILREYAHAQRQMLVQADGIVNYVAMAKNCRSSSTNPGTIATTSPRRKLNQAAGSGCAVADALPPPTLTREIVCLRATHGARA